MASLRQLRLPVARDGWRFIAPLTVLALISLSFGWEPLAAAFGILALLVLCFFRDPERKPPRIVGGVVSPADGQVTSIEEVDHPAFESGRAKRISIFLSLFNVHVNRAPFSGRIESIEYRPGRFHNALSEESSRENERNRIQLSHGRFGIIVDQIAGLIARRVVCDCREGDRISRGQRIGLIRFGSRTDTYLPLDADIRVKKGMKVRGGETVLAILPTDSDGLD